MSTGSDQPPLETTKILKISPEDYSDDRELRFELDFLAGLTTQARFELMFERSRQMADALEEHGNRAPAPILKRT